MIRRTIKVVGKIFNSNNFGKFTVLKEVERNKYGHKMFLVEFIDTGFQTKARKSVIKDGRVKDKFYKNVADTGFLGNITVSKKNRKIYKIWNQMINKCYNKNNNKYSIYGKKGVHVCERWHRFEYFLEDFKKIDGFNEKDFEEGKLDLDKDFKQQGSKIENKVYSLKTCKFLLKEKHQKIKRDNQKYFKAISPNGKIYFSYNQTKFSKKHNLLRSNISLCLNKKQKTHKGWRFIRMED